MVTTIAETLARLASDTETHFFIRNARRTRFPPNYQFYTHRHPELEINYLTGGVCVMGIDGQFVTLKQGDCILIYPGRAHSFLGDVKKSSGLVQIEYQSHTIPGLLDQIPIFMQSEGYVKLSDCPNLEIDLEQICRCRREKPSEWTVLEMNYLFFRLFIELSRCFEASQRLSSSPGGRKITRLLACINESYDHNLNLEELSHRFGLSSRYVRQYFQAEIGMKCSQYITTLRLNKAKELLWHTNKPVTEIALLTGFNSSQYFSKVFLAHTGFTPTGYRNTWHENLPAGSGRPKGGTSDDQT